ncbi:MAG: ABC transporter ATP-binding protein [Anderseniella sp.]|jgi:ATP-binding cassette subfamily B multidrug efflux pump|nr:ABC transporter ATP-binding protein [Anderseniella sp.]
MMIDRLFRWFETRTEAFSEGEAQMPPASLSGFIWFYTRPFWPWIATTSLLAATVAIIEVSLFAFLGSVVDWLAKTSPDAVFADYKVELLLLAGLVLVLHPLLNFLYELIVHQTLMGNFPMRIRWEAHRYVLRQSLEFFQNDFAGRIATKVMQAALAVRETVLKSADVFVFVIVYFTAALVLFAQSDWRLSLPMIGWLIGYVGALYHFVPRLKQVSKAQADARSLVTGRIVDSYTNIPTVKMFAHTEFEDQYARKGMEPFLDNVHQQMRLSTKLITSLNVLNALNLFGVGATSLWLWSIGAVSAGDIAFAIGLVLRLKGMSHWIMWEVSGLFENIGVVQDGVETISRTRSVVDAPGASALSVPRGEIRFEGIGFHYGKDRGQLDQGIIDKLTLTVKPGEKLGIVGRSGAGKSTLVSLLLRFYDLEQGRILIDGQDISKVTQSSLRAQIGMVTQDTSLLHRSIADNIRYGRPSAGMDEVEEAARKAAAHEFIGKLEDQRGRTGYDSHVGERGVKLSGGQRQRIAIARVLLKDAPILILDEATSALDSEVEAVIQESFTSLMQGKTVLAIAHRLSTIAAMDRLVVMDKGAIVEMGSHAELLEQGGLYASLWARQSGGFIASSDDASAEATAAE